MSKISELSDGGALQSTDYLIAVRSGGNVKVQLSELPSGIGAGGNIVFGDNEKAIFGAGSDLQIYHDGSMNYIDDAGNGDLRIRANNDINFRNYSNDTTVMNLSLNNGSEFVQLYYAGSQKLATTSTGIDVTGTVTADGLTVDGNTASQTYRSSRTDGDVYIQATTDADFVRIGTQTKPKLFNVDGNGDISFYEDTGTTPKFFWDASAESLGIGTSSPSYRLDVKQGTDGITAGFAGSTYGIRFDNGGAFSSGMSTIHGVDDTLTASYQPIMLNGSDVRIGTGATERMRIDSSGALLVGTTDNNVGNNSGGTDVGIVLRDYGEFQASAASACAVLNRQSTDGDIAVFAKDGTTVGSIGTTSGRLYIGDGDVALRFADDLDFVAPWNASTNAARDAAIDLGNSGNRFKDLYLSGNAKLVADSAASAEIQLKQTGTGGRDYRISSTGSGYGSAGALIFYDATASSERARIDSSGNLLVGTTSKITTAGFDPTFNVSSATNTAFLKNTGGVAIQGMQSGGTAGLQNFLLFYNQGGSVAGSISIANGNTATSISYNTSSDARLKENIADAEDAGAKVDAIQVRQFDWKADGSHQDYGMVAQELLTVAPEAVSGDPESDDMMGVDYSKLVPMMLKEIQSLRARVHALEGK
jgi:hypothetical protein